MTEAAAHITHSDSETVVLTLESEARAEWQALEAMHPWTSGTAKQAQHVVSGFQSVLTGRDGRLPRAARRQSRPWDLQQEPLRGCIVRIRGLIVQSAGIREIVRKSTEVTARLISLQDAFAVDLPSAWSRSFTTSGLSADLLDAATSIEEVEALATRIEYGAASLEKWQAELKAWIANEVPNLEGLTKLAALPLGSLEERYTLLLEVQALDRSSVQRRTALQLRSTAIQHVTLVAGLALVSLDEAVFRLTADYATSLVTREMYSDEIAAYRGAIAHYYSRAVDRALNGG